MSKTAKKQVVKDFWYNKECGTVKPPIRIKECPVCGKLPEYHSSCGGFNYYGYYKCAKDDLYATGRHQFPAIGIPGFGDNEEKEPQLFVVYNGEHNPEDGWNNFVTNFSKESGHD